MKLPDSQSFFAEVRREFDYLTASGFAERKTDESSLTAKIEFVGTHVAVSLALDRRDECMDCYVTRVVDGELARNDVAGGYWAPLHHFLIQRRRYRGGFREFRKDLDPAFWQDGVKTYARALLALAPDVCADDEQCLHTK